MNYIGVFVIIGYLDEQGELAGRSITAFNLRREDAQRLVELCKKSACPMFYDVRTMEQSNG